MVTSLGSGSAASRTRRLCHCQRARPQRLRLSCEECTTLNIGGRGSDFARPDFRLCSHHQLSHIIGCDSSRAAPIVLLSGVEFGELLSQMLDLGSVVENDVGLIGMQAPHSSGDTPRPDRRLAGARPWSRWGVEIFWLVELRDVGLGDALLFVACCRKSRSDIVCPRPVPGD